LSGFHLHSSASDHGSETFADCIQVIDVNGIILAKVIPPGWIAQRVRQF
jgi:hypothetical protein